MQVAFTHFGQFFAFVSFTNHGNLNGIHVVAYISHHHSSPACILRRFTYVFGRLRNGEKYADIK